MLNKLEIKWHHSWCTPTWREEIGSIVNYDLTAHLGITSVLKLGWAKAVVRYISTWTFEKIMAKFKYNLV